MALLRRELVDDCPVLNGSDGCCCTIPCHKTGCGLAAILISGILANPGTIRVAAFFYPAQSPRIRRIWMQARSDVDDAVKRADAALLLAAQTQDLPPNMVEFHSLQGVDWLWVGCQGVLLKSPAMSLLPSRPGYLC